MVKVGIMLLSPPKYFIFIELNKSFTVLPYEILMLSHFGFKYCSVPWQKSQTAENQICEFINLKKMT